MATVTFNNIDKVFPPDKTVISHFNLTVEDGEMMVLVGPSGCGKTTVLRIIAGLETITAGDIVIAGTVVNDIPPEQRRVGMVFQNYALYPHMTVRKNLMFPLQMRHYSKEEIENRIRRIAEMLGLTDVLERKPKALSGGQRQRVAMGRAVIRDADVFLMDEPLSNLDAQLRMHIRSEISRLQARLGITTLYVTHDQVEAMTLGHRVAVMHEGEIQQVATPDNIYHYPVNTFVAGFVGSPGMNIFPSRLVAADDGTLHVFWSDTRLPVNPDAIDNFNLGEWIGKEIQVGIRPECIALNSEVKGLMTATVVSSEPLGHETVVYFEMSQKTGSFHPEHLPSGVTAAILPGHHPLKTGATVSLHIDTTQLHFFDPQGRTLMEKR